MRPGDPNELVRVDLRRVTRSTSPPSAYESEALECPFVVAPAGLHLHSDLEKDAPSGHGLDLLARLAPDLLQHAAAFADDDRLVRLALDEQRGGDEGAAVIALLVLVER